MWFEVKTAFLLGVIWVFEKLRIIPHGEAENVRVRTMFRQAIIKRDKERESWGLSRGS